MELIPIEGMEPLVLAGQPDQPFLSRAEDASRVIEQCLGYGAQAVLLYAANLPPAFFDLSSGLAGSVLQRLQNYRIRLAVVCPPGSATPSRRFGELLIETERSGAFALFTTPAEALVWLTR